MDHIRLRGPYPRPVRPPPPPAPPPLLYSSWLIIQASHWGVLHPVPCPTHCQPAVLFTLPRGTGQDTPPHPPTKKKKKKPRTRADKALSFSLAAPVVPIPPQGPNMDPHKYLTPPPNLSPSFSLLLLLLTSSIALKQAYFTGWGGGRTGAQIPGQFKDQWKLSLLFKFGYFS